MSFLLAAVTQVSATPLPTPEVVVHTVSVTPDWIKQLFELLAFVVPGWIASFAHSVASGKSKTLRADEYDWLNSALLFIYSLGVSLAVLAAEGKLDLHQPEALAAGFLLVLGSASARYNALKLKQPQTTPASTPTPAAAVPQQAQPVDSAGQF